MVYIRRIDGNIVEASPVQTEEITEVISEFNAEYISFNNKDKMYSSIISDRQFFHALAKNGMISETEALNAVKTGDLPQAFEALINSLPLEQQFDARILLEGAMTFDRNHPLTEAFGQMYGMTTEQIDDLWKFAGSL